MLFTQQKPSQKQRILNLLLLKGQVSNVELNHEVGFRYGARIYELRKDGHLIETGPTDKYGKVIFTYKGKSNGG